MQEVKRRLNRLIEIKIHIRKGNLMRQLRIGLDDLFDKTGMNDVERSGKFQRFKLSQDHRLRNGHLSCISRHAAKRENVVLELVLGAGNRQSLERIKEMEAPCGMANLIGD